MHRILTPNPRLLPTILAISVFVTFSLLTIVSVGAGCSEKECAPYTGPGGVLDSPWPVYRHDMQRTNRARVIIPPVRSIRWVSDAPLGYEPRPVVIDQQGRLYAISTAGLNPSILTLDNGGNEVWRTEVNFDRVSVPALSANGTVYVGASDLGLTEMDYRGYAVSLDTNGTLRWQDSMKVGSTASLSPAIAPSGTVYFVDINHSRILAYSPSGCVHWSYETTGEFNKTVAVDPDGVIYATSAYGEGEFLHAISPQGHREWRLPLEGLATVGPSIAPDGTVLIYVTDMGVLAVSPTGQERWRYPLAATWGSQIAVAASGNLYLIDFALEDTQLYALDSNGLLRWSIPLNHPASDPLLDPNETVVVVVRTGMGTSDIRAYDMDQNLTWEFTPGGAIGTLSVGADGTLYGSDIDTGTLYALGGN